MNSDLPPLPLLPDTKVKNLGAAAIDLRLPQMEGVESNNLLLSSGREQEAAEFANAMRIAYDISRQQKNQSAARSRAIEHQKQSAAELS
tara:strand:+ start:608 stop:874 length:267 start_codon:yes stop_codon:yes gene_type:complete